MPDCIDFQRRAPFFPEQRADGLDRVSGTAVVRDVTHPFRTCDG